jgi:hypothetical protein
MKRLLIVNNIPTPYRAFMFDTGKMLQMFGKPDGASSGTPLEPTIAISLQVRSKKIIRIPCQPRQRRMPPFQED